MLNEVSPEKLKDKNLKVMPTVPCTTIDSYSIKSQYQLSKSLRVDNMQKLNLQCLTYTKDKGLVSQKLLDLLSHLTTKGAGVPVPDEKEW